MRTAVATLAESMSAEDGIAAAVGAIESAAT
jgi:hypothetical protein